MEKDKYFDEWPEDSPIGWWNDGRKKLNIIVRAVNDWTINGRPAMDIDVLLRHIDMGLQTFASQEGGGGWAEVLQEMQRYIGKHSFV